MNELISVIIPAYNHAKYVQETIKSIINQTYQDIELLIIDDGSNDETLQKIHEMKKECENRFVRFVFKSQENQGTCVTMNKLYELSKGDFVYVIASDDVAAPDAIEKLYEFLSKNNDYALAVGENKIIDANSVQCYWDKNRNIVYNVEEAFYFSYSDYLMKWATNINFFSDEFGSYPLLLLGQHVPNGHMIRKSIFEKTGYCVKEAPNEDYYLMLQIAKYSKMKYLPITLFYYRWHGTNTVKRVERASKMVQETRRYEIELAKKSKDARIKHYMKDYINSFPVVHFFKIPFFFELYKQRTLCYEQVNLKILGINLLLINKLIR